MALTFNKENDKDKDNDFERLFHLSLDLFCIASVDGYFLKVNRSFCQVLGYSEKVLLSKLIIDFIHPDDVESTIEKIEDLKNGINTTHFVNRYLDVHGCYRTLSWSATSDESRTKIFAVGRDVTHERAARHKLLQIEKVLTKETIFVVTDKKGIITEVNKKFTDISGYSEQELIGQNHRLLNSGMHSREFFTNLWRTISNGYTWSGIIENRKKSGEHYFVNTIITPLFNMEGNIEQYLAIRFDITDKIRIKAQLEKTLNILSETSATAKVGGWELDVASGNLTWTDETFNILEVEKSNSSNPILPQGLELFNDESKPLIENAVSRAIEFGEPYALELQAKTAKGNIRWVYTDGKANYKDGKIVSLSGTIQDIHERKETEVKYEQERLKSFHNAKLASLGELSAGVAHEINNPLSIISGSTQLLSKYLHQPEKLINIVNRITKSTDRIARIVNSLKKFSRTSEDKVFEKKLISSIVKEALVMTETKAKRHSVNIDYDALYDCLIMCDEVEIEQVIVNMINNAIDAIKNNQERWIKLSTSEEDNKLVLMIIDSGTGISKELQDKLFEPFFTTKKLEGTGLGLSITKGILDDHNATIEIDKYSKNTCFIIKFNKGN